MICLLFVLSAAVADMMQVAGVLINSLEVRHTDVTLIDVWMDVL